jgi:hypothetical protein
MGITWQYCILEDITVTGRLNKKETGKVKKKKKNIC